MGIYDRDYYRGEESGVRLGGDRMMVTNLILANVAVYIAQLIFGQSLDGTPLTDKLALQPDLLTHPWRFYQLLTYGFAHSTENLFHIVVNMLGLWFFGRDIEWRYGRKEFLSLYLSLVILSGLGWVVAENLSGFSAGQVVGASGAIAGVFMLYALNFPRRTLLFWFVLPVPAWLAAAIWLLLDIQGAIQRSGNIAFTCHLAGAAFGFLYFRTGWTLASLLPKNISSWKLPRTGPRLRIHDPDEKERDMTQQVDEILRKIQEQGQDSLSKKERRILEEASRRYQQKHR